MSWAKGLSSTIHDFPITDLHPIRPQPEQVHDKGKVVLFNPKKQGLSPRRETAPVALERYNLRRHQGQWVEQKRLGAQAVALPGSFSKSYCSEGCICACHSVKNWGRWTLRSTPFLGSLRVSYRGVAWRHVPCSNPRCKSHQSQGKFVRVDIQPPTWLLRATMSVFLSFGLPNPELVIRLNRVTEQTDVHSSMNQLLWAIQREEVVGVQHFLQTREVRADDLYGAPAFGFTPLRLALDRKSEKLARLL